MSLCCQRDERRDAVRRKQGWNGLDYVEVSDDQRTLTVYFLGKLPAELHQKKAGLEKYLRLEGGQRVRDIRMTAVVPHADPDPEQDDYLVIELDKYGDFSTYTLRLVGVEHVDPRYDHVDFSFKIDCPSDLDCAPACLCEPPAFAEPEINYLAKDYLSFRQLILDRLALLVPDWQERHEADIGMALVELLAYAGDYLSYYQDAVATEAYLDTARLRISVRRHVRLVDYLLHEGCNARAWVCLEVSEDHELDAANTAFITGHNDALAAPQTILSGEVFAQLPQDSYEVFEPLREDRAQPIALRAAHNEIHFHTWGERECCLERGSTSATLLDSWAESPSAQSPQQKQRQLKLAPGDVLIFEEVLGPKTGLAPDADPARRHAVRLTRVTAGEDPVIETEKGEPTPYVEIEWAEEDALPFTLCISGIGQAPDCLPLENISVARGNVILVDHGLTLEPEELGEVAALSTTAECDCANHAGRVEIIADKFRPHLKKSPLTFSEPPAQDDAAKAKWTAASALLNQDVRAALPQVQLSSEPPASWQARYDLIGSTSDDSHFVVELDNRGVAHLRFGAGELGLGPPAGMKLKATYRIGNGARGNVGAEAISRLVLKKTHLSGIAITVRNPLPARGGTDAEPIEEAKLYAPRWFRKRLERAIIAEDYEQIAERNRKVQRAAARLAWTGSWYEADVAIDPFGREGADDALLNQITADLEHYRRMGHDMRVMSARYVPLDLQLEVCALPDYEPAHVKAALLDLFSARRLPGGGKGFFHPDNRTFGGGIYTSQLIALAQSVPGVECAKVTRLNRLFESPNQEIENGVLPLAADEVAQLDNDPNYPERGRIEIRALGGR